MSSTTAGIHLLSSFKASKPVAEVADAAETEVLTNCKEAIVYDLEEGELGNSRRRSSSSSNYKVGDTEQNTLLYNESYQKLSMKKISNYNNTLILDVNVVVYKLQKDSVADDELAMRVDYYIANYSSGSDTEVGWKNITDACIINILQYVASGKISFHSFFLICINVCLHF
jgi:hypothetical protein